jgi:multimeric flavodoxin WrbA
MASQIASGVKTAGVDVVLKKVEDCTIKDLEEADGLVVGSPTRYSNIAWQIKRFLDDTILAFYNEGHSLRGKVCGCFTSSGAYADGEECLRMLELAFGAALKMKLVYGIILESKDVDKGNLSACYEYGQKIAQKLNHSNIF